MSIVNGMSSAEYHKHPAIGSSTAKLALRSLCLVKDVIDGKVPATESQALRDGELFHSLVLEPGRMAPLIRQSGPINPKTGQEYGRGTRAWAAWEDENPGRVVIDPWMQQSLERMPGEIKRLLQDPGDPEVSVFVDGASIQTKARPDWLCNRMIFDLKTIDSIESIDRSIVKYGYWFSAAWYRRVLYMETGVQHDFVLIFAEKAPPFRWRIVDLDVGYRDHGDEKVTEVIGQIASAMATGDWDDGEDLRVLSCLPEWMSKSAITNEDGSIDL